MPSPLYLCLHVRDFAAQALARAHGRSGALAVLRGDPPLERLFAINQQARILGLKLGMSRVQAESFPVTLLRPDRQQEEQSFAELVRCAEGFSPRIEILASPQQESCGATLVLDISGSRRLLGGGPQQIAEALLQSVRGNGNGRYDEYAASVAAGHNAYAALLAARGFPGVTTIAPGREAAILAPLPLHVLELDDATAQIFATWGIQTLGQLAALPAKSLVARVGQRGFHLQAQARGDYSHLLVPTEEPADAALCEAIELEHPVELLEPLLFLLSHMLEQVTQRAAQRALAIASVETCLILEGNALDGRVAHSTLLSLSGDVAGAPFKPGLGGNAESGTKQRPEHRRIVRPAFPERDRHTLLKLIQLDLELHPPPAAVIALRIKAHPARPQTAQQGLFAAQAPEAGRLEILLARLRKLVGEGRVGAPELLDSHAPNAFRITHFEPGQAGASASAGAPPSARQAPAAGAAVLAAYPAAKRLCAAKVGSPPQAMRMLRPPHAVAIELRERAPAALFYEGQRLTVQSGSGPWRICGPWWTQPEWSREEWDVTLNERPPRCLRLAHDPSNSGWYVIGIYD
jgi:protein ImuB